MLNIHAIPLSRYNMDIPILLPINHKEKKDARQKEPTALPEQTTNRDSPQDRRPHLLAALAEAAIPTSSLRAAACATPSRHHREETSARPEREGKEGASPWRPGPSRPAGCADEDRDEPLRREDDLAIHPEAGAPRRPGDVSDVLLGQTPGAGPSEPFQAFLALLEKWSAFQGALRRPDVALFAFFL